MHCPYCHAEDTRVIDSRLVASGDQIRRRRECQTCSERFTTYESAELLMPRVIKSNGAREPFNEDKLRSGLTRALEKRPVSTEELETLVNNIQHALRNTGERELPSRSIGEAVMKQLKEVDQVAYVRFASVYRDFQDISQFQEEIAKLRTETGAATKPVAAACASAERQDAARRRDLGPRAGDSRSPTRAAPAAGKT